MTTLLSWRFSLVRFCFHLYWRRFFLLSTDYLIDSWKLSASHHTTRQNIYTDNTNECCAYFIISATIYVFERSNRSSWGSFSLLYSALGCCCDRLLLASQLWFMALSIPPEHLFELGIGVLILFLFAQWVRKHRFTIKILLNRLWSPFYRPNHTADLLDCSLFPTVRWRRLWLWYTINMRLIPRQHCELFIY